MYKELANEFNNLPNDVARWQWIIKNQDNEITVYCDNDDTFATFDNDEGECEDGEKCVLQFLNYVGWPDGVFDLFKAIGVKAEGV